MKTIILARVSTEEQKKAGNSLPAQLVRLQDYAERKNLKVIKKVSFDESAFKTKREKFNSVIEMLKTSKEPIALCCDKIDRLLRNFTKELVLLEELRTKGKLELHFPSDNIVLHKDSPASDLFRFTMGVSLAKYYSDSISDNVKRAYENKVNKGEWIGKAPIGYINVINDDNSKNIIPDPTKSHYIIKLFNMYATGNYSLRQAKEEMEKIGLRGNINGKPLTISMIHHILKNPFYYGMMRIKGQLYQHRYLPLIDKPLFDKCQEVMAGYHKKPFKYASKPFVFRGLIKCADPACGCTVTPEKHKGHTYYSCTNYKGVHKDRTYIREEDLLSPVYKVLNDIRLPDEKIEELTNDLKKLNESKSEFNQQELINLRKEYDQIENRISRLFDLRADSDTITKEMFEKKLNKYKRRQEEINEKMKKLTQTDEDFYLTANLVLNLAKRSKEIFKSSEIGEKRQLLNFLLQNLKLKDKNLLFELKTPFDTVLQASKCSSLLPLWDVFRTIDWKEIKKEMDYLTPLITKRSFSNLTSIS